MHYFHKLASITGLHMHLKISRLFFWDHALAVKLNYDYLLVMKKMQFIFYSYCIHWQCGEDTFVSHQRATSELEFGSHSKTQSKAELPSSNNLLLMAT